MRFPKLRITWLVVWTMATILLVALWIRSHWWVEAVRPVAAPGGGVVQVVSIPDALMIGVVKFGKTTTLVRMSGAQWQQVVKLSADSRLLQPYWFMWVKNPSVNQVVVPYWAAILLAIVSGCLPWWPTRYSLRTMLIATTLIAVALGLFAYVLK